MIPLWSPCLVLFRRQALRDATAPRVLVPGWDHFPLRTAVCTNWAGLQRGALELPGCRTLLHLPAVPYALTSAMVLDGLRRDFVENEYLWSGRITPELYDEDCVFTDPTLTFSGLSTFEANLANLDPYIERFVPPAGRAVELDSLELADDGAVEARWRMVGDIAVPWKPRLDLRGCTRYTLGGDGGRIVRYDESWAITPAEALLQLVRPR